MNLFMRALQILWLAWRGGWGALSAPGRLQFRVWPHDLGWRDHLPNYRFCSFFELGRLHFWHGTRLAWQGHYRGRMIAAQDILYLRPVPALAAFTCETQLLGWDAKYAYFVHRIYQGEHLCALGLVKEVCLKGGRPVSLLGVLGEPQERAPMAQWQALYAALKAAEHPLARAA